MKVRIKKAKKKHWKQIKKLILQHPELLHIHLPGHDSFFVAVRGKKVVGCCALAVNRMEDLCKEEKKKGRSPKTAEIRSLAVKKKYRRRGIGKALIAKCLQRAKKRKVYEVITYTNAQKPFTDVGFSTFSQKTGKYGLMLVLGNGEE